MALATAGKSSSLFRGDFVIAMYLVNLLVNCRANRDKGPKYLPRYLPEWLKAAGACLNRGNDAEAALKFVKETLETLERRRPPKHKQGSTSSPPIQKRPPNEQPSLLDLDDEPLPRYSLLPKNDVSMQFLQDNRDQRKSHPPNIWVDAPPPPYYP